MGKDRPRKAGDRRRSTRPGLRIPIQVEGKGADGEPFKETTYTLAVNRHGARVRLKHTPRPNDHIMITNLQRRQQPCLFRVVELAAESIFEEPEWGIECLEPDRNFWGVYFPENRKERSRPEGIDALLECTLCHSREMAELTLDQHHELVAQFSLARSCRKCGMKTEWRFGSVEVAQEEVGSPAMRSFAPELFSPDGTERRRTKRFVVLLPLRIRDRDGREEVTRTENLSKLGISFLSDLKMQEGDNVLLTFGPDPGVTQPARIVWCRPSREKGRGLYGVKLEEAE